MRNVRTVKTVTVGKFKLVEKELLQNGEYVDTICEVKRGKHKAIYCSIQDALAHKCEWLEE